MGGQEIGIGIVMLGTSGATALNQNIKNEPVLYGIYKLCSGLSFLGPVVVLAVLGRDRLFNIMARRLERNSFRRQQDGAFVASLLDSYEITVGQVWWVHREQQDESHPEGDHRRNWLRGSIVEIGEDQFGVSLALDGPASIQRSISGKVRRSTLTAPPEIRHFPCASRTLSCDQIIQKARGCLRCIEWQHITKELMTGAICSAGNQRLQANELFQLSRPVVQGECIDYFMSHSWHDDAEAKWAALQQAAEEFRAANGRYPTFWLDKVCIDQNKIGDGLRALPVNLMACKKMMVLCGNTYACRLWCIWELFTLLAFSEVGLAADCLQLIPLTDGKCDKLATFELSSAHCYDPNEEAKLRLVIASVGNDIFQGRVRALVTKVQTRRMLQTTTSSRFQQSANALLASSGLRILGRRVDTNNPVGSSATSFEEEQEEVCSSQLEFV